MTKTRFFYLTLLLGLLTALGPFSIDLYLPSFPALARHLHASVAQVGLSLASFFIGISVGQLLYGPLLDRYGRKKPLYGGLLLYVVASVACLGVHQLDTLIGLRFVQALGSCAATVGAVVLVRDLFPARDSARVFALLMLVMSVSPLLAPTVGGFLTATFGWPAVFWALSGLAAALLLATWWGLPDAYRADSTVSLKPATILATYWSVLREPQFATYALAGAVSFSGLFAYVAASPRVFMTQYQVSAQAYGGLFAGLSVGLIATSQLNGWLLRWYTSAQIVRAVLLGQLVTTSAFLLFTKLGGLGLPGTLGFLFVFLGGLGFISPNTSALSLAPFTRQAGSAAALMGAIQMGCGAFASAAVSWFSSQTALPLAGSLACSALGAWLVLAVGQRRLKQGATAPTGQSQPVLH